MTGVALLLVAFGAGLAGGELGVVLNEINYHPLGGEPRLEFIELLNGGTERVDLSGWSIEGGVRFEFPAGAMLAPGAFAVVAADPARLASAVGVADAYGPWDGSLDNDGAVLILRRPDGVRVDFVHYGHEDPWPAEPDGEGATLELRSARLDNDFPWSWQASAYAGGTPGAANSAGAPAVRPVRINEVARAGAASWIEIVRTGPEPFALGGCMLARGAGLVVCHTFAPAVVDSFLAVPLAFEPPPGEDFYALLHPDGRTILDTCRPRFAAEAQSFGRFPDGDDNVASFAQATWNAPNAPPVRDDVYISEIMYHPAHTGTPPTEPLGLQYVAIANRAAFAVDLGGWRFTEGVHFRFPEGTILAPGAELVIPRDAAAFRAARPAVPPEAVAGSFEGALRNSREKLVLRDAWYNIVDAVAYADDGFWPPEADGGGAALCLRTSRRTGSNCAAAWEAVAGGTPGVAPPDRAIAPLVSQARHDPPVPRSNQRVLVTCRVADSDAVASVELRYRVNAGAAAAAPMRDDGTGGDERAGDGGYAALIGPFADGALVAFHIVADDGDTPGLATDAPGAGRDFLFVVDDGAPPANGAVGYRVLVTDAVWTTLTTRDVASDVPLDATFIGDGGEIRYNVGIRYRGAGSRTATPKNYRVNFNDAERMRGIKRLNLNRRYTQRQHLAMDIFKRAGLPYSQEWMVNLWIRGAWDDRYLRVEAVDGDFCARNFGEDDGELYRGLEVDDLRRSADFTYLGTSPEAYRPFYERINGDWDHDTYEKVIALCEALDPARTPDAEFAAAVAPLIDVEEWLLFFAAQACLSNNEGNIAKDKGDDYFIYFRRSDGKAVLIPWDFDTCFYSAAEQLFRPTTASIRRFLKHPAFAPGYHAWLEKLLDGAFSRRECRARLALIDPQYTFEERDAVDSYWTARMGWLHEHVPRRLRGGLDEAWAQALVVKGEAWRYFKGTREPSGGDLRWTQVGFDDSAWLEGPSGFGYGDGDDATVLDDMRKGYTTVFARKAFVLPDPAAARALTLRIDYDDGFAAYLNGQRIAARNAPAGTPLASWTATASREAGTPESIDVSGALGFIRAGENVLAVVGLNRTIDSSDASLAPELFGGESGAGGGCGAQSFAAGATGVFRGVAPVARTRRVEIAGAPAGYDYLTGAWAGSAALAPGLNAVTVRAFGEDGGIVEARTFTARRLTAMQTLQGTLAADLTLTRDGGPYYLAGAGLVVPAGRALVLEPGVTVVAAGGASILVLGRIDASGTAAEPILLLGARCDAPWAGIGLRDTGTGAADPVHRFRWCTFRRGARSAGFTGCVSPHNARLLLESCRFEDIRDNAVDAVGARVEIRNCEFEEIYEGVHAVDSEVLVADSRFSGMIGDNDAIDFDGEGPGPCRIERCLITDGMDDGVDLGGATCAVIDNVIIGLGDKAVSCETQGRLGPTVVSGNVIARSGAGIAVKDGAVVAGVHNTVTMCREGLLVVSKTGAGAGGDGAFESCIAWGNRDDVVTDALSSLALAFSDAGGGGVWPGAGNIREDPRFVDYAAGDWRLLPGSPCLGAAKDGSDMGALGIGTAEAVFVRGDANGDGRFDLSDAVFILLHLFKGRPAPCLDACDVNDSGDLDIADAVFALAHLYGGGEAPRAPFPSEGPDPTPDALTCGT
ncbi:MAG TPA: lamin tail domain-containing protein [Planctomycetota bacterium]|nr:lamin tail domain-containing protein [Planctomycetota bacterium]OQC21181.1 MAG: Inner spore coat protein H [Planctomycetes bacterium ADurb.Bin069]HNR99142.1 lamin tail domain-containing protein [Planctomycetota bacterium]HNU25821.1 lamin tail domain-containing protein [Planctomycetota bacterium]HOE29799.1 lamin tail domain-containing protein [Planctomycetota bacterium]